MARTRLSPSERHQRARIAAHASWANTSDRSARSKPGRDAVLDRFADEVDPDHALPEAERRQRALSAQRAHLARLSFERSKAARLRREALDATSAVPDEKDGAADTTATAEESRDVDLAGA
jgi:hypothetical protein